MRHRMALSKYESTRETTNFARVARIILGPCTSVLRDILKKEIPPFGFHHTVNTFFANSDKHKKSTISETQKQLVLKGKYSEFDITLLYYLLRNVCSIPQHTNLWGNVPNQVDRSVSANAERMRILRNEYGHTTDFFLSDSDFEQKWKDIFQIVKELESNLGTGTDHQDALLKLKTCSMDPDEEKKYIQKLSIVEQMQVQISDLEGKFEKLTVVGNVKGKAGENPEGVSSETKTEKLIFEQWGKENKKFVLTRACTEVEKLCRKQNLVIVTGHSGAGKTAIIHHIALKYRNEGWTVKPVAELNEIIQSMNSSKDQDDNRTLFVLNDPIGKESLDVLQFNSWTRHEEHLEACLKKVKLMVSCRKYILMDPRVKGVLKNKTNKINISTDQLKMSNNEKREVWDMHSCNKKISEEELEEICQTEAYFPLLCKLYSTNENKQNNILRFFKEPVVVFEEEIRDFRNSCKEKYCALILLVLFGNTFCVDVVRESEQMKKQFKVALELCGLMENTSLYVIKDTLKSLEGCFVKKIGDTYHFYHDFVMEVTTYVFGQDYPVETIKYADASFLRKRVKLRASSDDNDQFTIYLSDQHIHYLGKRLFEDIFTEHLLDVVFNPCLKNETIFRLFIEELDRQPEKIKMLLEKKKIQFDSEKFNQTSKHLFFSKLVFVNTNEGISPFLALVVFRHTQIFLHCLHVLNKMQVSMNLNDYFSAVCCNGSFDIFAMISKDGVKKLKSVKWVSFYPIHIVSVFHNYEILRELIRVGVDVNLKTSQDDYWTPLTLAAANNTEEYDARQTCESSQSRRDSTIKLLLSNGASVNLCTKHGISPLFKACSYGFNSTVELLLNHGAIINLYSENKKNSLHAACENGHSRIVKLLLNYGADINICMKNRTSPLLLACLKGHENTVQVLLENKADANFCDENGASPLYLACEIGLETIVNLILRSGADLNICMENGARPFHMACQKGHENIVQLLLKNGANINACMENQTSPLYLACTNGHYKTVQLLLSNGADIFLCAKEGYSPLHIACKNGYTNIVLILLTNGSDINSCNRKGCSPLYLACEEGHHDTVQLLLSHGADIDLYNNEGATPLYIACQNGHTKIVQLLLSNKADLNLCILEGGSPLHVACQDGHVDIAKLLLQNGAEINSQGETIASPVCVACYQGNDIIAQLLLEYDADINLCTEIGTFPLFYACMNGHEKVVQLLLTNGADTNLCMKNGAGPLHAASQNGNLSIVNNLLSHQADINLCMEHRTSPLVIACSNGNDRVVELLLRNEAYINLCTDTGFSPLIIACQNGHERTVEILLQFEADTNLHTKYGASPLCVAFAFRYCKIVKMLLDRGADTSIANLFCFDFVLSDCFDKDITIKFLLQPNAIFDNLYDPDSFFSLFVFSKVANTIECCQF